MADSTYSELIAWSCLLAWTMMILPVVVYLFSGWIAKRERIRTFLGPRAVELYYEQYYPSIDITKDDDHALTQRFARHYSKYYGRRHFIIPSLLLAAVAGLGFYGTALSVSVWLHISAGKALPDMIVSAFLGAFVWVASDQLSRLSDRDFSAHDVYNCVFRFLLAIPFGYSLAAFANKEFGVPLAFLFGVFPTTTLFTMARRLVGQKLGLGEEAQAGQLELESLQNVSRTNAESFFDEGVTTIAELAWTDPIDLSIRSNCDFNYIADCVSQALLWIYFETKTRLLYPYSLRGAQEVSALVADLESEDAASEEHKAAQQVLTDASKALNMSEESLRYTLIQVRDDPYTRFLVAIWAWGPAGD
jgi:hypothetical protein